MSKRLPSNALARLFAKNASGQAGAPSVNLTRVGVLYIVASLFQLGWPAFLINHWDSTKKVMSVSGYGWALTGLWILMGWCILHLICIGIKMIQLSRSRETVIYQTPTEKKHMGGIALILILGIVADAVFIPMLFQASDKTYAVALAAAMACRILKGNVEAILQYHRM